MRALALCADQGPACTTRARYRVEGSDARIIQIAMGVGMTVEEICAVDF